MNAPIIDSRSLHRQSSIPGAAFGVAISPAADESLIDLCAEVEALRASVTEGGAVLLRGFAWDIPALAKFIRTLVPRPIIYGGSRDQVTGDDFIQKVEKGQMPVSLHCELAFTPFRPDLCIFACMRPASDGGETRIADGAAVLAELDEDTRARFAGPQAITYQRLFPASAWQRTFRTNSRAHIEAALARFDYVRAEFTKHDHLLCHYTTAAIVSGLDGRPAWANNVSNMVEAEGIPGSTVTHADGQTLDAATRTELRQKLARAGVAIGWQPFDVLIIDNWRVMHGRNGFSDPGREIYAHFGNLRDTTLRPETLMRAAP